MNLSSNEESAYKAIYNKISSSGTHFTKGVCVKLMVKRGQIPAETAAKVFFSFYRKKSFIFHLKDLEQMFWEFKRCKTERKSVFFFIKECRSISIRI